MSPENNVTSTDGTERYKVRCHRGHESFVEPIDWPATENAPYHCPFCSDPISYEEAER